MSPSKTCTGLALALVASFASAAPKDDLHAAFTKFLAAKSFRATVTDVDKGAQVSQLEFVAPDRFHMKAAQGPESFIIGDTMYMDINGKLTPVPVPGVGKMVAQFRNASFVDEVESGMTVQALGDEVVDGEPATAYAYTVTKPVKSDAKAWVSKASGLPIQVQSTATVMGHTGTTRVRYSAFDDASIRIAGPN